MSKMEAQDELQLEYEHLRDYYDKLVRSHAPTTKPPIKSFYHLSTSLTKKEAVPLFETTLVKDEVGDSITDVTFLSTAHQDQGNVLCRVYSSNNIATTNASTRSTTMPYEVKYGATHSSDLKPQRMKLHTKKSKRCRHCEKQLIKPDPKTQITRFKIREMAK
jgi:hypothetical protein